MTRWFLSCLLACASALNASAFLGQVATAADASQKPANVDEKATHQDARKIEVAGVNAFCLNKRGEIFAACGAGPGEIKVLDSEGTELRKWDLSVKPESIGTMPNGQILVGGEGKLFRFSDEGELLSSVESPHIEAILASKDKLREMAISSLTRSYRSTASMIKMYEGMIEKLEAKQEKTDLNEQEERMLKALPTILENAKKAEAKRAAAEAEKKKSGKEETGPSEEDIQRVVDSMIARKKRIASISSNGKSIFVATSAAEGYGYDVWKMNKKFASPEKVVTGLRGCCGQMDVQACKSGIYVAENSRHRVVTYDADGNEKFAWGKRDRTGLDGFTSCCNPMNVCFSNSGDVYTAESNTGRIKRFSAEGEFLDFVGDVKLVPGCKNVSIAVDSKSDNVYMLDITRGHIIVMAKK